MTQLLEERKQTFWQIFARVMGRAIEPGTYAVDDVSEWDSLRHVELIFELEEKYGVDIDPATIVHLYSDTDSIIEFLQLNTSS